MTFCRYSNGTSLLATRRLDEGLGVRDSTEEPDRERREGDGDFDEGIEGSRYCSRVCVAGICEDCLRLVTILFFVIRDADGR